MIGGRGKSRRGFLGLAAGAAAAAIGWPVIPAEAGTVGKDLLLCKCLSVRSYALVNGEEWLRLDFELPMVPVELEQVYIGDTPISEFEDVDFRIFRHCDGCPVARLIVRATGQLNGVPDVAFEIRADAETIADVPAATGVGAPARTA